MFSLAGLIAGLFAQLLGKFDSIKSPLFVVAAGVLMIVMDLWYRMTRGEGSLLHPRRGGQFFYMPVWILGGFVSMFGLCDGLVSQPAVSARQSSPYAATSGSQKSSYPAAFADSPEPAARSLKLGMISGVGSHRIATINGQPFAEGESHALTIDATKRVVQCTEIHEQSVVVKISGESQPRELKIGEPLALKRQIQSPTVPQPSATQRFAGHEFAVPAGWTTEQTAGGLLLMATQVEDGWQANVFLEERVDREGRSLEQSLADLAPNLKARKPQFKEVSRKIDKLPGGIAYGLLEYSCTQQGTSLREWEVVAKLEGGKRLFILASSSSSRWDKYQPLLRSLLGSLH